MVNSSIKGNDKITVSGNKIRDYLHIKQVCKIIMGLSLKKLNYGLVNICSGKGISLKKLIGTICKSEKIRAKVNYIKDIRKNFEPEKFWGCNKKLKICLKRKR